MRRAASSIAAAVLAVIALPSLCSAGWRSADRWHPDDEEAVMQEPPVHDGGEPAMSHDHGDQVDTQWDGHVHDRQGHRHHGRRDDMQPGTQPYWGTMRPYWNSPEPPGVIHRQPRTAPLKIHKQSQQR